MLQTGKKKTLSQKPMDYDQVNKPLTTITSVMSRTASELTKDILIVLLSVSSLLFLNQVTWITGEPFSLQWRRADSPGSIK